MKEQLMIGVSRHCITPPLGTPLYGYPVHRPAQKVGDDLHVIAAAFTYGETKAIVFSADVCSCHESFAREIMAKVEAKTGFPANCMMINATHTHSGPNTSAKLSAWGEPDISYYTEILVPQAVKAGAEAVKSLRPALFGVATTECSIGVNRRTLSPEGTVDLGQNPWGVMDKEMTVLSFKDPDSGEILLNMIHYGCHGTAAGRSIEITRDWPGTMKDTLERETGAVTMFLQGAIGECGPRCPNGRTAQSYDVAKELGYQAGHDAVRAFKAIKEWRNVPLTAVCGDVRVPYEPLTPKENALAELAKLGNVEDMLGIPEKCFDLNEYYRWKKVLDEHESGNCKSHYIFSQFIFSIGPVAIVPFEFEIFFYISMQLRRYSKFQYTLSLSNTNGTRAYLPSQDQMCRGGYEVWQFRNANAYKLVDNADTYFVTENLKLLDEAYKKANQA